MNFKENEIVLYQNGDKFQVGRIKRLCDDGAFVWYHSGDTAAKTPYENLHKLQNATCLTNTALGKEPLTIQQLAPILQYCFRLSRMVSPADAQRHYGMNHDGSVSDFLNDLELAMRDGDTLNLNDDFYGPIYQRICEDVADE